MKADSEEEELRIDIPVAHRSFFYWPLLPSLASSDCWAAVDSLDEVAADVCLSPAASDAVESAVAAVVLAVASALLLSADGADAAVALASPPADAGTAVVAAAPPPPAAAAAAAASAACLARNCSRKLPSVGSALLASNFCFFSASRRCCL